MRLLVTGGAGFIGSNFIRFWLERHDQDEIVNLDLLTYAGDRASLADVERDHPARYTFIRGDIADRQLVGDLLRSAGPDVIVNFAAESHNSRAVIDPASFVRTNVLGTQALLESARETRIDRFHHVSTCEVYGDLPLDSADRFGESSPYRPQTPYSASKAAADLIVRSYGMTFALAITISNCSNNYGPWQHPEKVIPLFATNAIDDGPLPMYRESANRREWLHVHDHCEALELVILKGRPGETYNIGSGEERSVEQIADEILALLEKPSTLKHYVPDRPGHDRRYPLDHSKITAELGWRPRISFPEGLRSTIEWYRRHRPWWEPKKTEATVDEFAWTAR